MPCIFITGATGFLGTHLVKRLLSENVEIVALMRPNSKREGPLLNDRIRWVKGDVLDKASLLAGCPEHVDYIFHTAADTSMWSKYNAQQTRVNVEGTRNIIDVAKQKQARRLIYTSSISAYGVHQSMITEQTPQRGQESFANYYRSKHTAELSLKQAHQQGELDTVILNPCHLVGAWDKHNWSKLFHLVMEGTLPGIPPGAGSFCWAEEVANAHWHAAMCGRSGENYILAGINATFEEFVAEIARIVNVEVKAKVLPKPMLKALAYGQNLLSKFTGKEPTMTPEKVLITSEVLLANADKAVRELNYNPKIPLQVMLEDYYRWYLETSATKGEIAREPERKAS